MKIVYQEYIDRAWTFALPALAIYKGNGGTEIQGKVFALMSGTAGGSVAKVLLEGEVHDIGETSYGKPICVLTNKSGSMANGP